MTFHLQTRKEKSIRHFCPSSDDWNEMDLMDGRLHKRDRIIQTGVSSGKAKKRNQSLKKKKTKKKTFKWLQDKRAGQ